MAQDKMTHFLTEVQRRKNREKQNSFSLPCASLGSLFGRRPETRDAIILQSTSFSCFFQKISQVHIFGHAPKSIFAISKLSASIRMGQLGFPLLGAGTIPPGEGFGEFSAHVYKPAATCPTNEQFLRKVQEKSRFSLRALAT